MCNELGSIYAIAEGRLTHKRLHLIGKVSLKAVNGSQGLSKRAGPSCTPV